ncbi:sensor histidine kinase [Pelagicoccus mobilis]|uniref:histidine kinase n=1 Tax=Pelagicoccus mobilis TaxID=415221 RepID=A0A934VSI5_9BACT|nr:ATP-binding protein [Pelagicoccus mobilis]MBK1878708.1 hypothetical protein [Pelagicoccus mobilis]
MRSINPPDTNRQKTETRLIQLQAGSSFAILAKGMSLLGFALLCCLSAVTVRANLGIPSYTVFQPEMIGTDQGINAMTVDGLGRLALTSHDKLITFDGAAWKTYRVDTEDGKESPLLFALAFNQGRLFASSDRGIHEIEFIHNNRIQLIPLLDPQDPLFNDTGNLLKSLSVEDEVHFYSFNIQATYNLRTNKSTIRKFSDTNVDFMESDNNSLYSVFNDTILKFDQKKNDWYEIAEENGNADRSSIRAAENWGRKGIMLAPDDQAIAQLKNDSYVIWKSEIETLDNTSVLELEALSADHMAASVKSEGIFILNDRGHIVQGLNTRLDHRFGDARNLLAISPETLWASIGNSVVRIHLFDPIANVSPLIPSALTFPKLFKWKGNVFVESEGKLDRAVFFKGGGLRDFKPFGRIIPENIDTALPLTDEVICAGKAGIFSLKSNREYEQISDTEGVDILLGFDEVDDLFIAATNTSFILFKRNGGKWEYDSVIADAPPRSYFTHSTKQGDIWVEHGPGTISRVYREDNEVRIKTFTPEDGLKDSWINIFTVYDQIYFARLKNNAIAIWDEETGTLRESEGIVAELGEISKNYTRPFSDNNDNIWMLSSTGEQRVFDRDSDGGFTEILDASRSFGSKFIIEGADFGKSGTWLAGSNNVFLFSGTFPAEEYSPPRTFISRITSTNTGSTLHDSSRDPSNPTIEIPFTDNSLSFQITANAISTKRYPIRQYRIKGVHSDWKNMPNNTDEVLLSNLTEGLYTFETRSSFDELTYSSIDSRKFRILPPFYRSPFAYALYIILGISLYVSTAAILRRLAERRNKILYRLVAERTEEVEAANAQLNSANDELKELYQKAKAADHAKSSFLAVMSHEMRTPLNGVIGPCEILETQKLQEESLQFVKLIKNSGQRLLKFVDEVLQFSSNDTNLSKAEPETFQLQDLIDEVIQPARIQAEEKGLELELDFAPPTTTTWFGAPHTISQILSNLVNNAVKYTDEGKVSVHVSVDKRQSSSLVITVSDTGIGIESAATDKIFDPFFQIDDSSTRKWEGVGLGLSICKQLADQINATITVKSELDRGSCFTLTIPATPSILPQAESR